MKDTLRNKCVGTFVAAVFAGLFAMESYAIGPGITTIDINALSQDMSRLSIRESNKPETGLEIIGQRDFFPVVSAYRGNEEEAGFIACYHHIRGANGYSLDPVFSMPVLDPDSEEWHQATIHVHGFIRLQGFHNPVFRPDHSLEDIWVKRSKYSQMCNQYFSSCEKGCWAGGDTAGFFYLLEEKAQEAGS